MKKNKVTEKGVNIYFQILRQKRMMIWHDGDGDSFHMYICLEGDHDYSYDWTLTDIFIKLDWQNWLQYIINF